MPRFALFPFLTLAVLVLLVAAAPCQAVIIVEKGKSESIKGFLVSQNDARIVMDELLPNGETRQRVFERTKIDLMIISVSPERLSALRPDQPKAYRDYADELSEKREDPDARQTAIRLYLLAANLDPEGQGRGSLLSMAALARSPSEERKFRAMVYLLDPTHDRGILKPPSFTDVANTELTDSERKMVLSAIRGLRGDNRREALNFSRRPLFQSVFKRFSSLITLETFSAAAAERDNPLSPDVLKQLVTLELLVLNLPLQDGTATSSAPWSTILSTQQDAPVTPLSLETITEFDPNQTVFKNGIWSSDG